MTANIISDLRAKLYEMNWRDPVPDDIQSDVRMAFNEALAGGPNMNGDGGPTLTVNHALDCLNAIERIEALMDTAKPDNRGAVLVPREPTNAMIEAAAATSGMKACNDALGLYQARGYNLDQAAFRDGSPLHQAWRAMVDTAALAPPQPVDMGVVAWVRPLETAPKDGTYFLIIGSNFDGGAAVVRWDNWLEWWTLDDGKNPEIELRNEAKLTGWMPLPGALNLVSDKQ